MCNLNIPQKRIKELMKIKNSLSNNDLAWIINARKNDIGLFVGVYMNHCVSVDVESTCINGDIQINGLDNWGNDGESFTEWIDNIRERKNKTD